MPRWSSRLQRLETVGLWFESKWNLKFNQREWAEQTRESMLTRPSRQSRCYAPAV